MTKPFGNRTAMSRIAIIIGVLVLMVPGPSRAETTTTVRYVAVSGWQTANEGRTIRGVSPFGGTNVRPSGTTVTVTIADDVTPNGSFLFSICQRNDAQAGDYQCGYGDDDRTTGNICYTGPTTLTGVTPGNPVEIIVFSATAPCPDAPTTGTFTITS
jgi:hypothetical protein